MIFVAALLASPLSCGGKRSSVDFSIRRDQILDEVTKNTRTVKVYRDLDTIFIADVLWYKPELRKTFVSHLKGDGRIDDEQAAKMTADISSKEGRELEFITGLYTGDKAWNDLDKVDSMWRMTLKGADGSVVAPTRIEKLRVDRMQDSWLFPFLTPWKVAYRVTFTQTGNLTSVDSYVLRLSSVVGEGTFIWENK
jgi:hypothetical protein